MSRALVPPPLPTPAVPPDDTGCTVLHVDMDAFYASVELLTRPDLVGRPVIVGGEGRGVVLAATYEARAFGVHSAMPSSRAQRLCPQAIFVPPDFEKYTRASAGVMAIFRSVTPLVEPLSLDEAFLDVSGALRRLGTPREIAAYIKARIADEQGLPCSVGVATTKFVAKVASARCKPNGLLVVPGDGVTAFLHPLPVSALWGVGPSTEKQLLALGLRTVADIANAPVEQLQAALGPHLGAHLRALAEGRDERAVNPHEPERSIGAEETFFHDLDDPDEICRELLRLSERTAARLRSAGLEGRTIAIKVRYADFTTISRSRTLKQPTDVAQVVYATARELYEAHVSRSARLRLVGVRVEGLHGAGGTPVQLAFDEPDRRNRREAEVAADRAVERFGRGAVRPATLLGPPGAPSGER
ncbi:MAG TPA: DNA polymerase IV [Mycobacteriales bacterium]|nr:DNA polymerase IV [Mycobacteriales bacterium]